jgi:hypothetical protein
MWKNFYNLGILIILIISSIIIFAVYKSIFKKRPEVEGFDLLEGLEALLLSLVGRLAPDPPPTPPTPESKKYNIDVSSLEKAYDIKKLLVDKDKLPVDIRTAELLHVQFYIRQALMAAAINGKKISASKKEQAEKQIKIYIKVLRFLTTASLSRSHKMARAARELQLNIAEELKECKDNLEITTAEFSACNTILRKLTRLFQMSSEHELSQKIFTPYGDNAGKMEACDKLKPG